MPMLNPFRRQQAAAPKPSLRERLAAATGRRAAQAVSPPPAATVPASPFDDYEQVAWFASCGLVPFPSVAPQAFVKAEAAIRLEAGLLLDRARAEFARRYAAQVEGQPSTEYAAVVAARLERELRIPELEAAAREPADKPFDASDRELVHLVTKLAHLDAEVEKLLGREDVPEPDQEPEYQQVDQERTTLIELVCATGAQSLPGLQAKARAINGMHTKHLVFERTDLAASLADDLLRLRPSAVAGRPDPIYAAIAEGDRLLAAVEAAARLPLYEGSVDPRPEHLDALDALNDHRDNRLLGCVLETAAGCVALAAFAVRFARSQGVPLSREEGAFDLLEAMAECPAGLDAPLPGSLILGPDPVHAVIAESRRLHDLNAAQPGGLPGTPEYAALSATGRALFRHFEETVLTTPPTTIRGCVAFAQYVLAFHEEYGWDDSDARKALRLIAASLAPEA